MADSSLVQARLAAAMTRQGVSQMMAIRRVTEAALTEVSVVHRYAVDNARRTLTQAEGTQRAAGKPLDDPAFQQLTSAYLNELTRITEQAGVDILHVIDTRLR